MENDGSIGEIPIPKDIEMSLEDAAEIKALYDWQEASKKAKWTPGVPFLEVCHDK